MAIYLIAIVGAVVEVTDLHILHLRTLVFAYLDVVEVAAVGVVDDDVVGAVLIGSILNAFLHLPNLLGVVDGHSRSLSAVLTQDLGATGIARSVNVEFHATSLGRFVALDTNVDLFANSNVGNNEVVLLVAAAPKIACAMVRTETVAQWALIVEGDSKRTCRSVGVEQAFKFGDGLTSSCQRRTSGGTLCGDLPEAVACTKIGRSGG